MSAKTFVCVAARGVCEKDGRPVATCPGALQGAPNPDGLIEFTAAGLVSNKTVGATKLAVCPHGFVLTVPVPGPCA